jgi:hypothetical protein
MSIEKDLAALAANTGRIADALEKLLNSPVLGTEITSTPAETAPEPEPKASTGSKRQAKNVEREEKPVDPEPEVEERDPLDDDLEEQQATFTPDEVRAALRTYRDVEGDGAMMAVLKSFGATGMGSLKEADYAAVMAKVR